MFYKIFFTLFILLYWASSSFAVSPYYDTFSGNNVDSTKWQDCQRGEIRNGQLWLDLYGANSWLATNCLVVEENITNYISSQVSISRDSYATPGSSVAVKIGGIFYNDTYDGSIGYNNWAGNVFADIRLQLYMGELHARAVVVRYNNSTGSSKTPSAKFFKQAINFDEQYLLSIEFVGSAIVFKCNDESIVYPIRTATYPTNKLKRELIATIYADMGEQGYVGGLFDEICLAETCSRVNFLPSIYHLLTKSKE